CLSGPGVVDWPQPAFICQSCRKVSGPLQIGRNRVVQHGGLYFVPPLETKKVEQLVLENGPAESGAVHVVPGLIFAPVNAVFKRIQIGTLGLKEGVSMIFVATRSHDDADSGTGT